jgi:hypothetical protein
MAFLGSAIAVALPDRAAFAQRRAPRYLDRVSLTVRSISTVEGYLVYNYRFGNAATSRVGVASFSLDVSAASGTGRELLPATGPVWQPASRAGGVVRLDHVPAGPISPTRWKASFDVDARLKWYGSEGPPPELAPRDIDSIAPGRSLDGFGVRSSYLPGIRDFSAEPTWQSCCSKPKPGSEDGEHPDTDEFRVGGRTIGPMRAPTELQDPVRAIALIRRDFAASCSELLWIDHAGCINLRGYLNAASAAAASGDRGAIDRHLGGLLKELDARRGKGLNDNAYWLLRTNAQYLRDHLP